MGGWFQRFAWAWLQDYYGREGLRLYDGDKLGRSRCRVTRAWAEEKTGGRASERAHDGGGGLDAEEFSAGEGWGLAARFWTNEDGAGAGQGRAGQGRAGQGRTGQDRLGTVQISWLSRIDCGAQGASGHLAKIWHGKARRGVGCDGMGWDGMGMGREWDGGGRRVVSCVRNQVGACAALFVGGRDEAWPDGWGGSRRLDDGTVEADELQTQGGGSRRGATLALKVRDCPPPNPDSRSGCPPLSACPNEDGATGAIRIPSEPAPSSTPAPPLANTLGTSSGRREATKETKRCRIGVCNPPTPVCQLSLAPSPPQASSPAALPPSGIDHSARNLDSASTWTRGPGVQLCQRLETAVSVATTAMPSQASSTPPILSIAIRRASSQSAELFIAIHPAPLQSTVLHCSIAPLLHRSIAPLLHCSIAPSLHCTPPCFTSPTKSPPTSQFPSARPSASSWLASRHPRGLAKTTVPPKHGSVPRRAVRGHPGLWPLGSRLACSSSQRRSECPTAAPPRGWLCCNNALGKMLGTQ
ncbi:hypothetical protein PMIN01_04021 [Paraphaeosphaeria minitans]|uniref:Uncharacterized protein n=1 Tax=Paraphaeosphaeria minitans TaxID=565426 RepID=A0A9P6GNP6_9PLEO|nr:hypothetical protein PMIN01_04021 [Paraphaeosphaeria minitans]